MNLTIPAGASGQNYKLGTSDRINLQTEALNFYKVPGRFYHNYQHVYDMLDAHRKYFKCDPSDALYLAILMHDAVYMPGNSPASEDASTALVPVAYFRAMGKPIPAALMQKVSELIRWTLPVTHIKDNRAEFTGPVDAQKLLDLDLIAMSTSNWTNFIQRQYSIDREFEHLGDRTQRMKASADFLRKFVDKGFIYYSDAMQHLNDRAIKNLYLYIRLVEKEIFEFEDMYRFDPDEIEKDQNEIHQGTQGVPQ